MKECLSDCGNTALHVCISESPGFRHGEYVKNTEITYLYRDASNYKQVNDAIVAGVMTEEQEQIILSCLEDGEYFIPSQVGLPETRFSSITEDDHCWFELPKDFASATEDAPDVDMTVDELVQQFVAKKGQWDDSEIFQSEF